MRMDNFVDERDHKLLERDRYTFFVLGRILGGDVQLRLTDHEKLILCFTGDPYPVWIWTPDSASSEEMERAYMLAKENGLVGNGKHFNLKYELAEYFMKRAKEDGVELSILTNMFAYDCPEPIKPESQPDGGIHTCTMDDLEDLLEIINFFHQETEVDQKDEESYRKDAEMFISSGKTFLWKDAQGNSVASCKYAPNGDMASINLVFTHPQFRRKHYAENLVYQVSMLIKEQGYIPMLYTDADYVASNACYEKIGYILRGKLCTIG